MTDKDKYRNDFVIYFHRNANSNDIFYVGVGQKRRAYDLCARNFLWKRVVDKYGKPIVEIYRSNLTVLEAYYLEKYFIKSLGRRVDGSGNLTNMTVGGEGFTPFKRSEELINRSKKRKEGWRPPSGPNHHSYGKKPPAAATAALILAIKGKKQSESHIERRISKLRGVHQSKEVVERRAATFRGKKLSQDHVLKVSESSKKMWADQVFKKKMCEMRKGKVNNKKSVLDVSTGIIYNSCKEAANCLGIGQSYMNTMLGGFHKNKTNCIYIDIRPDKL